MTKNPEMPHPKDAIGKKSMTNNLKFIARDDFNNI